MGLITSCRNHVVYVAEINIDFISLLKTHWATRLMTNATNLLMQPQLESFFTRDAVLFIHISL